MNLLIDRLPTTVSVQGIDHEVRWQFRTFLLLEELLEEEELDDSMKMNLALELFYPEIPDDMVEAARKLIEFYVGGSSPDVQDKRQNGSRTPRRVFTYSHDHERIFTAFWRSYGVNLATVENLHWYEFKAMFADLDEDCLLVKVIGYRTMNISKIKDREQKQFYTTMRKKYALPLSKRAQDEIKRIETALLGDGDLTKR